MTETSVSAESFYMSHSLESSLRSSSNFKLKDMGFSTSLIPLARITKGNCVSPSKRIGNDSLAELPISYSNAKESAVISLRTSERSGEVTFEA